jgi:hypothetical protein
VRFCFACSNFKRAAPKQRNFYVPGFQVEVRFSRFLKWTGWTVGFGNADVLATQGNKGGLRIYAGLMDNGIAVPFRNQVQL